MEMELEQGKLLLYTGEDAEKAWKTEDFWGDLRSLVQGQGLHFCKAEVIENAVFGEIILPLETGKEHRNIFVTYYLTRDQLALVTDSADGETDELAARLADERESTPVKCFLRLLDELLKNDMKRLQEIEAVCYRIEEEILAGQESTAVSSLAWYRKLLLAKNLRYQQLGDMSDTLRENTNQFFSNRETAFFRAFGKKAERLYQHSQMLRETVIQIGELQRQKLEQQRNDTMRILTVVTALFSPLSLIAGWYGMNFVNMPELKSPSGYFIVAAVCIIIVAGELTYFKKKKLI